MEPDLKKIAEQAINEAINGDKVNPLKVKLFKVEGFKTYDCFKNEYKQKDAKEELELQINNFLKHTDLICPKVNIQVVKNFYPHTENAEYEEIWCGVVSYYEK